MNNALQSPWVACHDCDTLYPAPSLAPGTLARCRHCGAVLARNPKGGLSRPIALHLAALILLILANAFPFLALDLQGRQQGTTLSGASLALFDAGMEWLGLVVFLTTVLLPFVYTASTLYVLIGVRQKADLPGLTRLLSWLSHLRPWGMLDVFMLGVLVSFVKLNSLANVIVGPALYAYTGLILVSAVATTSIEPERLWTALSGTARRRRSS